MLAERFTNQRGTVELQAPGSPIDPPQQLTLQYDLNRLHMWILIHNRLHSQSDP